MHAYLASHYVICIRNIRKILHRIKIEILDYLFDYFSLFLQIRAHF